MTIEIITDIPERRDLTLEAAMESCGVSRAELREFSLADVNVKASLANQARISEPLTKEWVEDYRRALVDGAVFPPVIVTESGVVADGNHRTHAYKAEGREAIVAYVVDVTNAVLQLLVSKINTTVGHLSSPEDVAARAVYLYDTGALSFAQIGSTLNVSEKVVGSIIHRESVRRRVKRPTITNKITNEALARLDQIQSDSVLVEAARVVADTGMGQKAVRSMLAEVKSARSTDQALEAVRSAEDAAVAAKREAKKPKSAGKPDEFSRFMRGAGLVLSVNPTALALSANGSADDVLERARELVRQLADVEKAVTR